MWSTDSPPLLVLLEGPTVPISVLGRIGSQGFLFEFYPKHVAISPRFESQCLGSQTIKTTPELTHFIPKSTHPHCITCAKKYPHPNFSSFTKTHPQVSTQPSTNQNLFTNYSNVYTSLTTFKPFK